jgi:DinB family protein
MDAATFLADTRDRLVSAVQGLTPAQWTFKADPERWSIAEIVEHVAAAESLFSQRVTARLRAHVTTAPNSDTRVTDAQLVAWEQDPSVEVVVPGHASLAKAPPPLVPSGAGDARAALARFLAARAESAAFLESTRDARHRVAEHPALGPLDGYQWVLFMAAHSERHLKQIRAVIADPHFPK